MNSNKKYNFNRTKLFLNAIVENNDSTAYRNRFKRMIAMVNRESTTKSHKPSVCTKQPEEAVEAFFPRKVF